MKNNSPNFKEGDSVICIYDRGGAKLVKGDKYVISKVFKDNGGDYRCFLYNYKNNYGFYCSRFLTEFEYATLQYNL